MKPKTEIKHSFPAGGDAHKSSPRRSTVGFLSSTQSTRLHFNSTTKPLVSLVIRNLLSPPYLYGKIFFNSDVFFFPHYRIQIHVQPGFLGRLPFRRIGTTHAEHVGFRFRRDKSDSCRPTFSGASPPLISAPVNVICSWVPIFIYTKPEKFPRVEQLLVPRPCRAIWRTPFGRRYFNNAALNQTGMYSQIDFVSDSMQW
jgi:hypothetical protein